MQITPLTPTTVKTYNRLFSKILKRPMLEHFFEIGIGLIEVEPDERYVNKLVQEIADDTSLNMSDLNLYLRQVNEFYNSAIMSYELVDIQNPDEQNLAKLEEIVASLMQLEPSEKNRKILIEACDHAIETIALEYDFLEELNSIVVYDELVEYIASVFDEMTALNSGFFSLMGISQMLKKGATEDEFYGFSVLMTIVLASYNEVRKYRYESIREEEIEMPALEEIVKPYQKTKVASLLSLGRAGLDDPGLSYRALGLSRKNKEKLLNLGANLYLYYYSFAEGEEDTAFYAVVHAWKALSELEIPEAKSLFVELLGYFFEEEDEGDWMASMFRKLIVPFRAEMFEESVRYILDEDENEWFRAEFIDLLQDMIKNDEVDKEQVSGVFKQLFKECNNRVVNASAIAVCKDEKFDEHYPQIKKLYEKKLVDKSYDGDLEDVEMAFGIRTERSTPRDLGMSDDLEEVFANEEQVTSPQQRKDEKIGRNDPCPCGSGKKYKKCCMEK